MSQVKCHSLRFTDCHLVTTLQLVDVGPSEKRQGFLEFTRSSFDKLELVGNRFDQFHFVSFTNSDITKAFIAETAFPDEVRSLKVVDGVSYYAFNNQQTKLFAEQLKTIYQGQGNRTEALYYQAKELDAHYQELNWKDNQWDKATLLFNKWTTNYGTSWVKGLRSLLVVSFFLYLFLVLFSWPSLEVLMDWRKWSSEFVEFINPTSHIWKRWDFLYELCGKSDDGKQIEPNAFIKLWLLFSKVVIVTMIYQIVQAFRKFGKR